MGTSREEAYALILQDSRAHHKGRAPCEEVGYYLHFYWPVDLPLADVALLFQQAEAQALSEAFGYPVRVTSLREGNGHGVWKVEPDVGPVCWSENPWASDPIRCRDPEVATAWDEAFRQAKEHGGKASSYLQDPPELTGPVCAP